MEKAAVAKQRPPWIQTQIDAGYQPVSFVVEYRSTTPCVKHCAQSGGTTQEPLPQESPPLQEPSAQEPPQQEPSPQEPSPREPSPQDQSTQEPLPPSQKPPLQNTSEQQQPYESQNPHDGQTSQYQDNSHISEQEDQVSVTRGAKVSTAESQAGSTQDSLGTDDLTTEPSTEHSQSSAGSGLALADSVSGADLTTGSQHISNQAVTTQPEITTQPGIVTFDSPLSTENTHTIQSTDTTESALVSTNSGSTQDGAPLYEVPDTHSQPHSRTTSPEQQANSTESRISEGAPGGPPDYPRHATTPGHRTRPPPTQRTPRPHLTTRHHTRQHSRPSVATPGHTDTRRSAQLLDHSAPSLDHSPPNLDHSTPNMDHSTPNMDHSTPNMDHSTPNLDHGVPTLDHREPLSGISGSDPRTTFPAWWGSRSPGVSQPTPAPLSTPQLTSLAVGVIVAFWLLLGPLVCVICRAYDRRAARRRRKLSPHRLLLAAAPPSDGYSSASSEQLPLQDAGHYTTQRPLIVHKHAATTPLLQDNYPRVHDKCPSQLDEFSKQILLKSKHCGMRPDVIPPAPRVQTVLQHNLVVSTRTRGLPRTLTVSTTHSEVVCLQTSPPHTWNIV